MTNNKMETYPSASEDIALRLDPPPHARGRETITALTICCDNEETIRACMEGVKWCDEILVVIDPRSTDATRDIVREYTDRIFENEFTSDGLQRNLAIPRASCDWVLVVDSDEVITPELCDDILQKLKDPRGFDAFNVRRIAYFLGKAIRHCGWGRENQLRLFRRDKGRYDSRRIHAGVQVLGAVGQIDSFMLHNTTRNLADHLAKQNDFTSWASADLHDKGTRPTLSRLLLRPMAMFIKMYFLRLGFLEGMHGLLLCGFAASYVFAKYAKLWELRQADAAKGEPEA
ncbi:MAG: glycosyltransferase family 2 protein [Planctomycetes bacterium]|nr:glycosyltransferase family 2 protein [Planctomycetota bacterium]